jgi:hypothetical protein
LSTLRRYDCRVTRSFIYDFHRDKNLRPVRLDAQLQVWAGARIEVRDEPDIDIDVDIVCAYSPALRRIAATSVTAIQRDGGPEVTSASLRTVRVQEFMRRKDWPVSYSEDGQLPDKAGYLDDMKLKEFDTLLAEAMSDTARWRDDQWIWCARTYRYAEVIGLNPALEVTLRLGLSERTASRRIAETRLMGLLPLG